MDRAEALNDAVDALLAGRPDVAADDLRPLLDEGRALLGHRPEVGAPRATFVLGLEAQLVTDLRLRAPNARRFPDRRARFVLLGAVLVGALLLGPARSLLPGWARDPLDAAWETVSVAVTSGPDGRVRQLLAQGWRHLERAEDAALVADGSLATERALGAAVARYRLALAAAARPELDERLRRHAAAEVQLVMTRMARQAHGRPLDERAVWTGARGALGRLLLVDARVVHFPASPRIAPIDVVHLLPPPTASASAAALPATASAVPPATAEPTRESWPTGTSASPTATTAPSIEPSPPATSEPATAIPARPPATSTPPAPTESPAPPARAATPTQDRWPTATPQGADPVPTTIVAPQPSAPPPSEPPPPVP